MVLCAEPPPKLKIPNKITEMTEDANHDSPKLERRKRMHHIERHRHAIADAAWEALKSSIVYFRGQGTVAAIDKSQGAALNYEQVFMRDFIPSALAFLMKGEHLMLQNFLVETARLQPREKKVGLFKLGQGVMLASFKLHHRNSTQKTENLLADFGETAIGRVAPVDSGLWWIIHLRAYTRWTGDTALAESPNYQRAMDFIFSLCLPEGCDTSPALLCADGCSMIDRRMVFLRDFIPSALAFLMKGEHLMLQNFLVETACLQSREKMVGLFKLGQGVMLANCKVHHRNPTQKTESLLADFGETAIGRVAPVDSGLWWILLLRAYTRWTGDTSLAEIPNCQRAVRLIFRLCLSEGCDTSPALLCADGCSMINRRMFSRILLFCCSLFIDMRCALSMLKQDSNADFVSHITKQIIALSCHLHSYYWFDFRRLNDIYNTEEFSQTALNKFNVIPESIPDWIFDFMPGRGGYFIGNVNPVRMDLHWFCLGNIIAIMSPLATGEQAEAILDVVEECWEELIRETPVKICYPAMENKECQIITVCDLKNTKWSCHNGGSWPDEHALEMSSQEEEHIHGNFATFFVKLEGTTISVRQDLSITTTKMLLEHAYKRKGIRSYDGYALYCGKVLDDNKLLFDSKVCNDCTVEVKGRGRAGRMQYRKRSLNGKFNASQILFYDGRVLFDKCCKDKEAVAGFDSWPSMIDEVPAMYNTLMYDPWSDSADPEAARHADEECEETSYYTGDTRGCLKFSRNHFRHAKLEEVEWLRRLNGMFTARAEGKRRRVALEARLADS
ncbi:hypothetical protein HU200_046797 [Digitaria exilis]|uniref:Alkaline/neutral invertase n=1 Tax=Digitaria exilis TaxID=1010633 RepID=A0A835AYA7_9POAL|nr:hypothetical protein HU200_046797 [Digitaria exilis]